MEIRFDDDANVSMQQRMYLTENDLEVLSSLMDLEVDDGSITDVVIDVDKLMFAASLFSAMEEHQHNWR